MKRYKLKENPDEIPDVVSYGDNDARAFGYYKRKFYIGKNQTVYHQDLNRPVVREQFSYPGRLWVESKIISFWKYPKDFNTLKKIAKDIKKEIAVDILSNGWRIEIVTNNDKISTKGKEWDENDEYETELIPTTEYKQSGKRSEEEMNIQHVLSPMLKTSKTVPPNTGSRKGHQSLEFQKKYTSESKVRRLKENPDVIELQDLNIWKVDARAFGYYKRKFYIGDTNKKWHNSLVDTFEDVYRKDFDYAGRLWFKSKIISFWKYPEDYNTLKKISKDIKEKINVDILSNGWKIEIVDNEKIMSGKQIWSNYDEYGVKLIPTNEYKQSSKRSETELNTQHILSPLQKSHKVVPPNTGSKRGHQSLEFQKKYTSESKVRRLKENPNKIINKKLNWDSNEAYAFGYLDNKLEISSNGQIHYLISGNRRDKYKYAGRLWIKSKIISFWEYPKDFNTLKEISKDIKEKINVDILSNGWLIEILVDDKILNWTSDDVYETDLIPTTEYKQSKQRSKTELNTQHILSPLQKSHKVVPPNTGSRRGHQSLEFQKKYTSEQLIRKIVKEEIKKFKNK